MNPRDRMEVGTIMAVVSGLILGLIAGIGAWRLTHLLSLVGAALVGFVLGRFTREPRE